MSLPPPLLAFDTVGTSVFRLAWIVLVLLVFALLAAAARYFAEALSRADAIVFDSALGLDRESAIMFYDLYRGMRPRNVAVAWFLAVILGPIGVFWYLRDWQKFALAFITLNGLGAWSLESWFSVPRLVLLQNQQKARWAIELMPAALQRANSTTPS